MKIKVYFFLFILIPFLSDGAEAVVAPRGRIPSVSRASQTIQTINIEQSVKAQESSSNMVEQQVIFPEQNSVLNESSESNIENKSSSFSNIFGGEINNNETPLQRSIREQKLKLFKDVQTSSAQTSQVASAGINTAIECDNDLRKCMTIKCGDSSFSRCFNDSDTDWGIKIDSCRLSTKCTGEEFSALSAEVKADMDQNFELSGFGAIINCGKIYNNCVRNACGNNDYTNCISRGNPAQKCKGFATNYQKCWNKSGSNSAISSCDNEYKKCQIADSGLVSRAMEVLYGMKIDLEKNVLSWDQKLYDLKDSMKNMCKSQNAMFDERSLQCVYTAELYADKDGKDTLFSSKKLQSDAPYTCTPDWFGIDITTFKENAFRLTRNQTSATSAMMGAGLGVAVGSVATGAIDRAVSEASEKEAEERIISCVKRIKSKVQCKAFGGECGDANSSDPVLFFIKDGKKVYLGKDEAYKLSNNWNYDKMRYYSSEKAPFKEYEKDACEVADRIDKFIESYVPLDEVKEVENDTGSGSGEGGGFGDPLVSIGGTTIDTDITTTTTTPDGSGSGEGGSNGTVVPPLVNEKETEKSNESLGSVEESTANEKNKKEEEEALNKKNFACIERIKKKIKCEKCTSASRFYFNNKDNVMVYLTSADNLTINWKYYNIKDYNSETMKEFKNDLPCKTADDVDNFISDYLAKKEAEDKKILGCIKELKDKIEYKNSDPKSNTTSVSFKKNGITFFMTEAQAIKLSNNWHYKNLNRYDSTSLPLKDYERDACEVAGRVSTFIENYKYGSAK